MYEHLVDISIIEEIGEKHLISRVFLSRVLKYNVMAVYNE